MAVSSDGLVVHAGGLVESGNVSENEGFLSREAVWRETQAQLEQSQLELQSKESSVSQLQEKNQQQQEQIDKLQNEDRRLSRLENESVQKLSGIQRRVDHIKQQRTYLGRQKDRQDRETERLHERIKALETAIANDEITASRLKESLAEARANLEALPVAEAQQQQEGLQQGITAAETIVAGRLAVVDSRRTTLVQVEQQLNRLGQRRQSYLSQQETLAQENSSKIQQRLQEDQEQIDEAIKPIRTRLVLQREELFALQNKTAEMQRHAHGIETAYTQTQVRFTQQESQIESLRERIHTDLGLVALRYDEDQTGPIPLPISDVFDQLPKVSELPSDIEKTIQQYRGQLQRMGGINPDAPAEYEETQTRFDFMTQQVEDLYATEEQLRLVISELDILTSKAFADTVERVNSIFGDTFTQLFGGGSARLVLTDPDDLTVSGVDIIARLPNRHEQGLGLLSGGERSLTASALIFSLLKVSPTPFCVLDEVDAALDEANINRFSDILRELSLKTQIIVITHNRGTVQAAQTIYGVSMQPDSASQVISIRPEEYVRQELI
jgi:chromosome segregation protein